MAEQNQTAPDRVCEGCRGVFPPDTPRWYVDPDGVELCPDCADDLRTTWALEGFQSAVMTGTPNRTAEAEDANP